VDVGDVDLFLWQQREIPIEWRHEAVAPFLVPEVDRAEWSLAAAREKILPGQRPLLDRLE